MSDNIEEEYERTADGRVLVPIEIPDDELLVLFKAAHERDITFNQFVEEILRAALNME